MFVIIGGLEVGDCVDETEDKPLGGPADDDVHSHIVFIGGSLVGVAPGLSEAGVLEEIAHPGKAAIAYSGKGASE